MPAVSKKQQQAMAIAAHEPEKLYDRNKGLAKMSQKQLSEFASTPRAGLPERIHAPKPRLPRYRVPEKE